METYIPLNLDPKEFKNKIKEVYIDKIQGGIYELFLFENNNPKVINRFNRVDTQGLLCIGMAEGILDQRVGDLQIAVISNSYHDLDETKASGHTQMGLKFFRIRKHVDVNDLFIKVFLAVNPKEKESEHIEYYVRRFGELPTLNGQY